MVASLTNADRLARMNSLTTYWLCRAPGSATEGPFTLAQLRAMYGSGSIMAEALVCRNGEEEWLGLEDELQAVEISQENKAAVYEQRRPPVKRKRGQKNGCVSAFFFLFGVVMLFVFWPIGLLIILAALIMDHVGCYWMCGACKNEVAPKARVCPCCKAPLKGGWF